MPDRPPIKVTVGESVSIGPRSPEWPAFVFVTSAHGDGWVPIQNLSAEVGEAVVEVDYDTTELPLRAGQTVEVLVQDDASGWWWCRNSAGNKGWVPISALADPTR